MVLAQDNEGGTVETLAGRVAATDTRPRRSAAALTRHVLSLRRAPSA